MKLQVSPMALKDVDVDVERPNNPHKYSSIQLFLPP